MRTYRPKHTSAYSRVTRRSVTMVSPRGARPHPPGPKARLRMRRYLISGRKMMPSAHRISLLPFPCLSHPLFVPRPSPYHHLPADSPGLISMSSGLMSASSTSVTSFGNGSSDRPWKLRAQSRTLVASPGGTSLRPDFSMRVNTEPGASVEAMTAGGGGGGKAPFDSRRTDTRAGVRGYRRRAQRAAGRRRARRDMARGGGW